MDSPEFEQGRSPSVPLPLRLTSVLAIWLVSRAVLIVILIAVSLARPDRPRGNPLGIWDSQWYLQIATEGYAWDPADPGKQNVAFFPAWPLLLSTLRSIPMPLDLAGTIMANLMFLAALILLHDLYRSRISTGANLLGIALLSFFPSSLFFSVPYSESFFLLAAVLVFWLHERRMLAAAMGAAFLCGLSRPNGWLPGAAILLGAVCSRGWRGPIPVREVLIAAASACGTLAFLIYCHFHFGDFTAPIAAQARWHVHPFRFHEALLANLSAFLTSGSPTNLRVLADCFWALAAMVLSLFALRQKSIPAELRAFALLGGIFPVLMTGGTEVRSLIRYTMVIFPIWFFVATLLHESPRARYAVALPWIAFFLFLTARFCMGRWVQ